MENREVGMGWPLGLGSMNMRLRLTQSLGVNGIVEESLYVPSTTFSSFSSSNLDTESTVSFFQDNSKSLGRLMGLRSRRRRSEQYSRNSINPLEEQQRLSPTSFSEHQNNECNHNKHGICLPLCLVPKMSCNKDGSRR